MIKFFKPFVKFFLYFNKIIFSFIEIFKNFYQLCCIYTIIYYLIFDFEIVVNHTFTRMDEKWKEIMYGRTDWYSK